MTETKANKIVNRKKVLWTILMVPLAIPISGLFIALTDTFGFGFQGPLEFFFFFSLLGLTYGAIFWIPAVLLCWIIEAVAIGENSHHGNVLVAFITEAVIAIAIMAYVMSDGFLDNTTWEVVLSILLTQGLRWWYLSAKDRMYVGGEKQYQDAVLDDTEL